MSFNAERKESVDFKGVTYDFVQSGKQHSFHDFALHLSERKSTPSVILMDPNFNVLFRLLGFKQPPEMLPLLKFVGEGYYKKMDLATYMAQVHK